MAGNRKLQAEITQVLKKIEEGMSDFDEIWEKVYAADTQAHKERWEAELKKEIKKLQRFRDQIKGWLSSPEIKDKSPLLEARRVCCYVFSNFPCC
jgi:CCR4-NOT transcription complex subunit 3